MPFSSRTPTETTALVRLQTGQAGTNAVSWWLYKLIFCDKLKGPSKVFPRFFKGPIDGSPAGHRVLIVPLFLLPHVACTQVSRCAQTALRHSIALQGGTLPIGGDGCHQRIVNFEFKFTIINIANYIYRTWDNTIFYCQNGFNMPLDGSGLLMLT